jgi:hypothetical protein
MAKIEMISRPRTTQRRVLGALGFSTPIDTDFERA